MFRFKIVIAAFSEALSTDALNSKWKIITSKLGKYLQEQSSAR